MLFSRRAVHCAMWLALTMICLAVLYIAQDAIFLGVVQVVVYTGVIMMLFLFVLMIVGVDASDSLVEDDPRTALRQPAWWVRPRHLARRGRRPRHVRAGRADRANADGNVQGIARLIFTRYVFAFELTSIPLITAAVARWCSLSASGSTPR